MFNFPETTGYPSWLTKINDDLVVERIGLSDFKISFNRNKYFLKPEVIDCLDAHISIRSNLSADFDVETIGAGIIRISLNAVNLNENTVSGIINLVIEDLLSSASAVD